MKGAANNITITPMLFPIEPDKFWTIIRQIIREEMEEVNKRISNRCIPDHSGIHDKSLYKIAEVCRLFRVTKPTIYVWMRHGKLKPLKIRSRVYFLANDIQELLQTHRR